MARELTLGDLITELKDLSPSFVANDIENYTFKRWVFSSILNHLRILHNINHYNVRVGIVDVSVEKGAYVSWDSEPPPVGTALFLTPPVSTYTVDMVTDEMLNRFFKPGWEHVTPYGEVIKAKAKIVDILNFTLNRSVS